MSSTTKESFRLQSCNPEFINNTTTYSVNDSQMCDEHDIRNVIFGLRSKDLVMSSVSVARIPVYITLRHDKSAEHWDEIICPRFPNLRNSLQDTKFFPDAGEREEYGLFAKTLNEVLSGDIVTAEALCNLESTEFSEWLCSGGMSEFRYRNRYSFVINVVNVFPYTVDVQGNIHFVGRCFNQEFLKSISGYISKQFLGFAENFTDVSESATHGSVGLQRSFAALNLPVFPAVFVKTDLEDTLGDEFFRYITFTPRLGSDSIVEIAVKSAVEIDEVSVMAGKNIILNWEGKELVTERGMISISEWKNPMPVQTFEKVVSSHGEDIILTVVDSLGRCHEYTLGKNPFSLNILPSQQEGVFQYEALFIDMGSTFSKMLAVGVDGECGKYKVSELSNDNKIYRKTSQFLEEYGLLPLLLEAMNNVPNLTKLSEPEIAQLAVTFKEKMAETPDIYARFLARAIKSLARHYLEKYNMILDSVRWSFPKTRKGNFFNKVQDKVRNMIVGYTRQTGELSFRLYPEHEALRLMFDSAIRSLSEQTHRAQKKYDESVVRIENVRSNKDTESRRWRDTYIANNTKSWWHWIDNGKIKKHANAVADSEIEQHRVSAARDKANEIKNLKSSNWYASGYILQMLFEKPNTTWASRSSVFKNLSAAIAIFTKHRSFKGSDLHKTQGEAAKSVPSYGYLDAGGYSLDSVVVDKGSDILELTRSFKTGGEQLLMKVCALYNMDFANENDRKLVLKSINNGIYDGDAKYGKIVAEVYRLYVEPFERFVFCGGNRGSRAELWYLVFSGGVSINSTFQRLFNPILRRDTVGINLNDEHLPDVLKQDEFASPKISSKFLYEFAENIGRDITIPDLEVFRRIVRDRDNGRPCETYDIVGGMLQDALKNH